MTATVSQLNTDDKLIQAMKLSVNKVDDKFRDSLSVFLKPETLAVMGGVLATWGALHLVGVGEAADVALLGAGTLALGVDAVKAGKALWEFFDQAQHAQTPQELDRAAERFAEFVNIVGVNGLALLTGAKLGKVVDELGQLAKENWGRIAELGQDTQRLVGSLFKSGQELLGDKGRRLGGLLDEGLSKIDNLLSQLGLHPQLEAPGVGRGNPMQAEAENSGIATSGAETVAAQAQRLERQLVSQGVTAQNAHKIVELAAGQSKVLNALDGLLNGRGNLRNPNELSELVKRATKDGEPGILRELEIAAARVRQGHDVQLGTVRQPGVGKVGADVVDYTTQEAIHSKNITSPAQDAVEGELSKSARQFEGKQTNPEIVPTRADGQPFRRVTEVIVNNPQNPLHNQTPKELAEFLQDQFRNNPKLQENIDAVRITNQSGVHEFKVIRSERTHEFQFISPTPTQPHQVSQVETQPQPTQIAQQVPANALATETQQSKGSIAEQVRANRELYPLPQLRTTIAAASANPQSPQEVVKSVERSNPSLHDTLSRLNNVIDELDKQTLARQPQPSPAQRLYEKTAQSVTQQTGLAPGHSRFEPVLAAKLLAEHGYNQAASIIAAGSPRLNEVNATFGNTTADRQLAELMRQGEQTLQAMRPEQQKQQGQMEQG